MKIAVVGCGAVGSYYGAKLGRSGQETHFLLRSDYDVVRRNGVQIRSAEGDFLFRPHCARSPEEIGTSDLVLIGLKTTANDQLPKLLAPLVGKSTVILTLQNGLGNEALLARSFGAEKVLGGLCFVCLNRLEPGVILHIAHGAILMGEYQRPAAQRTHDIAEMIRKTGITCRVTDSLDAAHWEKLVWNVPFNGLGAAGTAGYEAVINGVLPPNTKFTATLDSQKLLSEPRWEKLVRELMLEVIATANALGHPIPQDAADKQVARTHNMGAYKASTLLDFEHGLPLELETLFFEPLHQAKKAGVPAPRLARMCDLLAAMDSQRK